jgi:hypothetical protein
MIHEFGYSMGQGPVSQTIRQLSNDVTGWPKAKELIEFTGHHVLEAQDRALLNSLYQIAHDSGRMTIKDAEWIVPLADLRPGAHESNDRLRQSFKRLKHVVVTVPYYDQDSDRCELITGLFDFFDLSKPERTEAATVRFGLPKELQPILAQSERWGRIRAEIVHAMSSKYAIALYELVQARINMETCVETFPLDRFRALLGVSPGKLERGASLMQKALKPAEAEVNALADVGVTLDVKRKGGRANGAITHVTMAWWRKQGDEYRASIEELKKPKTGRKERLKL